jgi:hypothetical protein
MNFKSFALKAAIGATVLASSTLAGAPAEALELGSQLNFVWDSDATPTSIDFYLLNGQRDGAAGENIGEFNVTSPASNTGSFASLVGVRGVIQDLTSITAVNDSNPNPPVFTAINNFLFFGSNSPFNFKLTSFQYETRLSYIFSGIFADGTLASGEITTQILGTGVKSYSATITAGEKIPTPALLPGLIGMGAAVLRKRKAEENEQVEAEA